MVILSRIVELIGRAVWHACSTSRCTTSAGDFMMGSDAWNRKLDRITAYGSAFRSYKSIALLSILRGISKIAEETLT